MDQNELRKHIENIIKNTFERLQYAFDNNKESDSNSNIPGKPSSRIVFPSYSNNSTRISEQELRFCFSDAFIHYCDNNVNLFYSIETPTKDKYSGFSKTNNNSKPQPKQDNQGRSGEFDMVIFDENMKRICLIEFKANNASKLDHEKDLVKLENINEGDDGVLRYFIEIVDSYTNRTGKSICEKIETINKTIFICYSLNSRKEEMRKP